jgi:hypothetical protein
LKTAKPKRPSGPKRKGTSLVTSPRAGSYREALASLRAHAETSVASGIEVAREEFTEVRFTRSSRRLSQGMALEALYSGILDAVAGSIADMAAPGREVDMAHLVADLLVQKVERMSCLGQA